MIPVITAVRLTGAADRETLPLLVLGPAQGSSAVSLWADCAALLAADFEVLAWDLPGHGYNAGSSERTCTTEELAAGVLAVVDDVLAERGKPGQAGTAFAYAGIGIGGEVGEQLADNVPDRVGSHVTVPAGLSPSDQPDEVAALIAQHVLGRPAPTPQPTTADGLYESAERRRIDDLSTDQYAALHDLSEALGELCLAGTTTALPSGEIRELTRRVRGLSDALSVTRSDGDGWPHPVTRITRTRYETPRLLAEAGRAVRINDLNPMHPALDVRIDATFPVVGRSAIAEVTLDALQEGPPESVHGGTLAFLMDSILGILVQSSGVPAVTGYLNTRYLARTPLERPVTLGSRIVGREGRKISVESWVEVDGVRTAEATAMFIEVAFTQQAGDPG